MGRGPVHRRVASLARRHRLKLVALATVVCAGAGALALTGAQATAAPASAGRVIRVLYAVRRAPDPPPPTAFTLMPTVPSEAQPAVIDPGLAGVQAAQAVRVYDEMRARDAYAIDADTRRAYAAADETLTLLPHWPEATTPEPPTAGPDRAEPDPV